MSASKRPSTSSLRRFICSRAYVPVAEIRRRFGLDEAEGMFCLEHDGRSAFVGLPEREGLKLQDLVDRDEIGLELSVEVNAPVVVGVYPMRIARYFLEGNGNGYGAAHANEHGMNGHGNGHHPDFPGVNGTALDALVNVPHGNGPAPASPGSSRPDSNGPRLPHSPATAN